MYGVVRCTACGRAQGVDLRTKSHRCTCGTRLLLEEMKPLFTTAEPRDLPAAVGRVRAALEGAEAPTSEEETAAGATGPRPRPPARERRRRTLDVLRRLSEDPEGFTPEDARAALEREDLEGQGVIERFRRENLLYEVKPGRYRLV